jgi:glycosyltransferase involved in cell wall biosynthesis
VALKYLFGKKLIASIHGGDIRHKGIQGMLVTLFLKRCDRVVCYDNKGHFNELVSRGIKPTVIPNGIDLGIFVPGGKSKTKTKKAVYVGGTREVKGFYDIIAASSDNRFNDGNKDFEIHIYADGSIASDTVTQQHPPLRYVEMPKVFETGQLFVLPSHAEGVPTAMLEAMASGMYVIASKLDYTKEILDEKFLFNPRDSGRLADLMVEFRDNKKKYFGNQNKTNRRIVEERYSIDNVADKWKFVINTVLNENRA